MIVYASHPITISHTIYDPALKDFVSDSPDAEFGCISHRD